MHAPRTLKSGEISLLNVKNKSSSERSKTTARFALCKKMCVCFFSKTLTIYFLVTKENKTLHKLIEYWSTT